MPLADPIAPELLRTQLILETVDTTPQMTVDVEAVPDKRAKTIERVVGDRYMPPWKADPAVGEFHDVRRLSDAQITYALADVTHLRDIFRALAGQLEKSGRSAWLEDEMQEALRRIDGFKARAARVGVVGARDYHAGWHTAIDLRNLDTLGALIEGGADTVSRFIAAKCLDRLHVVVAPMILGSGRTGISLPPIETCDEALRVPVHVHQLGDEVLYDCDLSAQRIPAGFANRSI